MKYSLIFFLTTLTSVILLSCEKHDPKEEVIIDYFTYGKRFNFREVSMKIGDGEWTAIEKGNTFTLLGGQTTLEEVLQEPVGFATYDDRINLKTDFVYTIEEDLVFSYKISNDMIYFLDENKENRTDLIGEITLEPNTEIILHNSISSPNISIKYRFEK